MTNYRKVLFAVDLGESCEQLAKKAQEIARQFKAKLIFVHTIEPIPAYGYPGFQELQSPIIDSAREQMVKLGKKFNVSAADQHIVFGSVKTQIIKVVEEMSIDLVIIGSHGRHGLSRLLGSGASAIIHGVSCDVFILRTKAK